MPRDHLLLHPQRVPVTPLDASTLLLLRDLPDGGCEVLMTRRSERASFAPGMYVFPGGGIEAQDAQAGDDVVRSRDGLDATGRTAATAALRETFEEMGLLLAVHADGSPATQADVDALDRHAPLWPQLRARGLRLDVAQLWQIGHFTADRNLPKRFAVPFFVARMPSGQTPEPDNREQFEPVWVQPAQALERFQARQMPMIFPTIRTLTRLAQLGSTEGVLAAVVNGPLWKHSPRTGLQSGKEARFTEDEAPYGELAMVCPDGQCLHPLDWQSEQPVPLRKNLLRLTAPNASVMTGPGTNSYLVGEAATGFIAIDPGPADAAHIQRLYDAAGGDIRAIVCTHSHADHAPGAFVLQQLCQDRGVPRPQIHGLPSAPTASASARFTPDLALQDGERLVLSAPPPAGQDHPVTHTLRAVFTPGHAANHVCLVLEEDELLFSGDHILNGSTPIVNPPDGNMDAYLRSLDTLDAICAREEIDFILPAHGYVLGAARAVIARLRNHRLAREAKVLAAMQALPGGSMQDWVQHAYADTPQPLWKLAERSLLAHVERIQALGLAPAA